MKATETKLLKFLNKPQQFVIPIYQRTYSWTRKECNQLWQDLIRAATNPALAGHFIGSVVYIEKGLYQVSTVPQLLVIDGQQRLTTMSLLLTALSRAAEETTENIDFTAKQIRNYYLFNNDEEGSLRYKLLLTQSDKDDLHQLLDGKKLRDVSSSRIRDNYSFFIEQIKSTHVDLNTLYQGINKLIIVDIALDRDHDNPQLIFESLNSTGLELSQADLIRNYVLMGLEPKEQEALYTDHWHPMEIDFGPDGYVDHFDKFMRDYLTLKTNRIPNISEVYEAFKLYTDSKDSGSIQDIISGLHEYSKHFVRMALEKEPEQELREIFADINTLKVDVAYPLLLELYQDYSKNVIERDEFKAILKIIESYVFRRVICGIPTNSLNKTFATISREINKENYVESLAAALLTKSSYRRFPDDAEFERELMVKDVYNLRNRNYWLRKLENLDRKEVVNVETFTIEHIMPQNENISDQWKQELGEDWARVHATYLHTIGNLTLTGYNSELSDRPFQEKRSMKGGFADSPIRLNKDLAQLENWNEKAIRNRSKRLAQLAMKVWQYPPVNEETLKKYTDAKKTKEAPTYSLELYSDQLVGSIKEIFDELRHRILNLDSSVTEAILKHYIAYKSVTNFVDIRPRKSKIFLSLNMAFDEVNDPKGVCENLTGIGHSGNGDVGLELNNIDQVDYAMSIVKQSLDKQFESEN